jgi:hypothetical protein
MGVISMVSVARGLIVAGLSLALHKPEKALFWQGK